MAIKGYPKKPKTYDDMATVPVQLSTTSSGQPFLVLNDTVIPDNPTPNAKRMLIFMSQDGRDTLASCSHWYIDGSFKVCFGIKKIIFKTFVIIYFFINIKILKLKIFRAIFFFVLISNLYSRLSPTHYSHSSSW